MLFRLFLLMIGAPAFAADFDPRTDCFDFANETLFAYSVNREGRLEMGLQTKSPEFARRCFPMVRGVMQFQKFAKFEPGSPKLAAGETRVRLRKLFRIDVWRSTKRAKIVFPGYRNLREFSQANARVVQEEIGKWWPSYFRVGNWRMGWPLTRLWQKHTALGMAKDIERGKIRPIYLAKFPSMNHAVIAYSARRLPGGDIRFQTYDPNYANEPSLLDYRESIRGFHFHKRFYFPGGEVRAMPIYHSPFH